MENIIIGFDPADDPDQNIYSVDTIKDGQLFIGSVGTSTGRLSGTVTHKSQTPKSDDFWKWSPERMDHAEKIATVLGINMDVSDLESRVKEATARHKHYAEIWEQSMAGPRRRLASVFNELMVKFLRAGMLRRNKFKIVKVSKARKRKQQLGRTRSYHEVIPTIKWVSPTGRLNPSQPAQYHFTKAGIKRTPRG